MTIKDLIKSFLTLALIACSTGHCRRDGEGTLEAIDAKPPQGYKEENLGSIIIAKPDGSLQCGQRDGMALDEMADEQLKDIKILSAEKRSDGLMRIQRCGAETGMLNTYEIKHENLLQAQKSGFTVLKEKTN